MTSIRTLILTGTAFVVLQSSSAFAAGSGMPWEAPLTQVLESIEGPVARIVAVIIIIITGLSLAFGDTSGSGPDHLRAFDCLCRHVLLSRLLLLWRRRIGLIQHHIEEGHASCPTPISLALKFHSIGR
jgi:hypothetical protein